MIFKFNVQRRHSPFPCAYVKREFRLSVVILAGLILLTGCVPKPVPTLRLGINAWPGYEFLYLAQEKGFFRDAGVDVRLLEFSSLPDCRRAYEHGQIDALGATVIEVLQIRDHSRRSPQIVRVIDYSNGADVILAQPSFPNAASLRGARVGVELASLGVYVLSRGLEKNGLALSDIRTVSVDQTSMEDAFRKGELDAVVTYPPTSVKLLRDNKVKPLFSTSEIPGEVIDVIAVEETLNTQNPEQVSKMLSAFDRAVAYAKEHPAEAYAIMAAREGITPAEFAEALSDGVRMVSEAEQAAYFQADGKLKSLVDTSDRILRLDGQIKGADRRAGAVNAGFVPRKP
jgi:NitT/TauT family transport system substrate-binding protein